MLRKASISLGHVSMPLWSLPKLLDSSVRPRSSLRKKYPSCDGSATFPLVLVTVCGNLVKPVSLR